MKNYNISIDTQFNVVTFMKHDVEDSHKLVDHILIDFQFNELSHYHGGETICFGVDFNKVSSEYYEYINNALILLCKARELQLK